MTKLNYPVFVNTIKPAFTDPSMTNITRLLFGFLDDCPEIVTRNKQPYIIDNMLASNWCNQKVPIPKAIRKAVQQPDIRDKIVNHFEDSVYYEMAESTLDGIFSDLIYLVSSQKVSVDTRKTILDSYQANNLSAFLAYTFILAVFQSDKAATPIKAAQKTKKADALTSAQNLNENLTELSSILAKIPKPTEIKPPEQPESSEAIYLKELLAAYGDAENIPNFSSKDLEPYEKYKDNFARQRVSYYAAESVRRSVQDLPLPSEENPFATLMEETFDGIIDVHDRDYKNGYERLSSVLIHATTLPITKSLLGKMPHWIGSKEKKGICHMLVNERRIKWVIK